jgi:hypothetical protein
MSEISKIIEGEAEVIFDSPFMIILEPFGNCLLNSTANVWVKIGLIGYTQGSPEYQIISNTEPQISKLVPK